MVSIKILRVILLPSNCSSTDTDDCVMLCHSTLLSKCIDTAVQLELKPPIARTKEKEDKKKQEAEMKEKRQIQREEKQREKMV